MATEKSCNLSKKGVELPLEYETGTGSVGSYEQAHSFLPLIWKFKKPL